MARPADELLPIFRERTTPPPILAWGLVHRKEKELREAILQNVTTGDEVIEEVAAALPEQLAELVVINQVRLLRRYTLLEALETNPPEQRPAPPPARAARDLPHRRSSRSRRRRARRRRPPPSAGRAGARPALVRGRTAQTRTRRSCAT